MSYESVGGGGGGFINNCTANYIPYSDGTDIQTSELYRVSASVLRLPDVYTIRNVTDSVKIKFYNDVTYGDALQILAGTSSLYISDGTGASINELRWDGAASAIDISATLMYLSHSVGVQLDTAYVNYTYATPSTFAYFDASGNLISGATYGTPIVGSIAAGQVAFGSASNDITGEAEFYYETSTNTLSVGGTDSMTVNGASITTRFATHAADGLTEVNAEFHKHGATQASGAIVYFARSRGSAATPTVVQADDTLAYIGITGYDGTDYALGGYLKWTVGTACGNNDMPTSLAIGLSPDGSQTPTDIVTISYAGAVAMSNTLSVTTSTTSPIFQGSTSASGTLTLRATSNATDGDIIFQSDATTETMRILSTGELVVGATAVVSGEFVSIQKNANAATLLRITNTTSGTAARSGVILQDSAGTNISFNNFSAGYTTVGMSVANTGVLATSKGAGMNIGCSSNAQLSFWTNNVKVGSFLSTGQFLINYASLASGEFFGFQKNQNAISYGAITNTTSGTAGGAGLLISNSGTLATNMQLVSYSAGFTTSGIAVADTAVVRASNAAGMNVGTTSNTQLSFWTNNTKRAEWNGSGQYTFYYRGTTASTSTSVTFTSAHYGTSFLWSPGGTATGTLPANGAAAGSWFDVYVLTNQTTTISAATADTLITVNDTAADSVAFSTAGSKIGSCVRFISNGTYWIAVNLGSTTMTVAT